MWRAVRRPPRVRRTRGDLLRTLRHAARHPLRGAVWEGGRIKPRGLGPGEMAWRVLRERAERTNLPSMYALKEIYYTLQGEGAQAGRPAVFCRFAGSV